MKIQLAHSFEDIINIDNLLLAWREFIKGKRKKKDVQEFQLRLMDNIFSLHNDLAGFTYRHGGYQAFNISDPKPRNIHKAKHYIRYADDFVILSEDKEWLNDLIPQIQSFLNQNLKLTLHPDKIFVKTPASGVDFLGWVNFEDHRVLRTTTKRRMMKKVQENPKPETVNSYLGLLGHGNTYKLKQGIITA